MKTTEQSKSMKVKTNIKAGGMEVQHNQTALRDCRGLTIKSGVKGGFKPQPDPPGITRGLRVKSAVKAGGLSENHNQILARENRSLRIKTKIKAGGMTENHNQTVARARK